MNKNVYRRPDKPKVIPVTRRTIEPLAIIPESARAPVVVHKGTECHVTPPGIAERMAHYLGHCVHLLEPSAGTGNLILAADADRITVVEQNYALCQVIQERCGFWPEHEDFLDWETGTQFDGILMNPPFSKVKAHVEKAKSHLAPGGRLVALVPITFKDGETLEELPSDAFTSCRVYTKIIYMEG